MANGNLSASMPLPAQLREQAPTGRPNEAGQNMQAQAEALRARQAQFLPAPGPAPGPTPNPVNPIREVDAGPQLNPGQTGAEYQVGGQGYFQPNEQYSMGTYGQEPERGPMPEPDPNFNPDALTGDDIPSNLRGDKVHNVVPNDRGGWDVDIEQPDGSIITVPVDSGEGSMISDNPGFRLSIGNITQEDINYPKDFDNDTELNEGQMARVDAWREQMGPNGHIWAYEPTTQMRIQILPDQLAGAMEAGYRFDPSSISQGEVQQEQADALRNGMPP